MESDFPSGSFTKKDGALANFRLPMFILSYIVQRYVHTFNLAWRVHLKYEPQATPILVPILV